MSKPMGTVYMFVLLIGLPARVLVKDNKLK